MRTLLKGLWIKLGAGDAGFDYTKLDKTCNALNGDALSWACIIDNHTGLLWEVKPAIAVCTLTKQVSLSARKKRFLTRDFGQIRYLGDNKDSQKHRN